MRAREMPIGKCHQFKGIVRLKFVPVYLLQGSGLKFAALAPWLTVEEEEESFFSKQYIAE
jgi:hypothetical protein